MTSPALNTSANTPTDQRPAFSDKDPKSGPVFEPERLVDHSLWPGSAVFHRARQLVGTEGLNISDLADLQQDLAIHAWRQWPKFDPSRASPATFLDRILRQRQREILRQRRCVTRGPATQSLPGELSRDQRRHFHRDHVAAVDCQHDVRSVLVNLSPEERRLALGLMRHPITQLARKEGRHRQRLHESLGRIRKRLAGSALWEYLP
jgi:DNA-directed RNA polymerase specialized sigma24 family protein